MMPSRHNSPQRGIFRTTCSAIGTGNFATSVWYQLLRHLNLRPRRPYQTNLTAATLWLSSGESPESISRQLEYHNGDAVPRVLRFRPNLTCQDGAAFECLSNSILPASLPDEGPHA